jgi:hypothetical protein
MRRTLLRAAGAIVVVAALLGVHVATSGTSLITDDVSANASVSSGASGGASASQEPGTALGEQTAQYPWAIRLQHSGEANGRILATYTSFVDGRAEDPVFESTDDGKTFTRVGTIAPGVASGNLCCTSLFELPRQVGALPPGTLLWSGSVNANDRPMSLPVWRSDDHGRTWSPLSTCATSPNEGGVWEPTFSVDESGNLNCYFSDESDPAHSQKLVRTVSSDGVHWGPTEEVVALSGEESRPGMPVVDQLPDGRYFMTYEICSTTSLGCPVRYRTSSDGRNWGDATDPGTEITGPDGRKPGHTPKFTVTSDGRIVLATMTLHNADGSFADGNGKVLYVNSSGGTGVWEEVPAPVTAIETNHDVGACNNYSPALLPVGDGEQSVLEITTREESGTCRAFYGTGESTP